MPLYYLISLLLKIIKANVIFNAPNNAYDIRPQINISLLGTTLLEYVGIKYTKYLNLEISVILIRPMNIDNTIINNIVNKIVKGNDLVTSAKNVVIVVIKINDIIPVIIIYTNVSVDAILKLSWKNIAENNKVNDE